MPRATKRHPSDCVLFATDAATAHDHDTAGEVLARLRARRPKFADVIYVLDSQERLQGAALQWELTECAVSP